MKFQLFWCKTSEVSIVLNILFIFFREKRREGGREGEKHRCVETWPTTQACSLTWNQTCGLLLFRTMPNLLSYASQGSSFSFSYGYPIVPAPFVENVIFSSLNCFCTFFKSQLGILCGFSSGFVLYSFSLMWVPVSLSVLHIPDYRSFMMSWNHVDDSFHFNFLLYLC